MYLNVYIYIYKYIYKLKIKKNNNILHMVYMYIDALHASYISDVHWSIYNIIWNIVATLITCNPQWN